MYGWGISRLQVPIISKVKTKQNKTILPWGSIFQYIFFLNGSAFFFYLSGLLGHLSICSAWISSPYPHARTLSWKTFPHSVCLEHTYFMLGIGWVGRRQVVNRSFSSAPGWHMFICQVSSYVLHFYLTAFLFFSHSTCSFPFIENTVLPFLNCLYQKSVRYVCIACVFSGLCIQSH